MSRILPDWPIPQYIKCGILYDELISIEKNYKSRLTSGYCQLNKSECPKCNGYATRF